MSEAFSLMWRDIEAAPALVVVMVLPVVFSIILLRRGSRLAWGAPSILVAQVVLWFTYYATDWFNNPGVGGAVLVGLIPTLVSVLVLVAAWARTRHRTVLPGVAS